MWKLPVVALVLVAAETQLSLTTSKNAGLTGSMGGVARGTVVELRMLMLQADSELLLFVTVVAKLGLWFLQTQSSDQAVWLVADRALPGQKRTVRHRSLLPNGGMAFPTGAATFEARALLELG